MAEGP